MATLVFILISLTAAVFHGAAPVRAEDVSAPTPIVIDEKTASVTVKLYTDEYRTQELKGAVTSDQPFTGLFRQISKLARLLRLGTMLPFTSFLTP